MSTQTSIIGAFIIGAVIIGLRYWIAPDTADAGALQIGGLTLAVMAILAKLGETKNAADAAKVEAVKSTAASKENAQTLHSTAQQQSVAIEEQSQIAKRTEEKVDGHLGSLMQRIELLEQKNASLEKATALKVSTDAQAETSEHRIIAAGEANVAAAAALAPPIAVDAAQP